MSPYDIQRLTAVAEELGAIVADTKTLANRALVALGLLESFAKDESARVQRAIDLLNLPETPES